MNRPEIYQKSNDVLYKAYFDSTLEHRNCTRCAVGNLCNGDDSWGNLFTTETIECALLHPDGGTVIRKNDKWKQFRINSKNPNTSFNNRTGYTLNELEDIEWAFEAADKGKSDEDWMFNGLVAVLEVLKEIHEVTDEELIATNKNRFVKHYQSKTHNHARN